jgi:glutamyl-tRNA reductase
MNVEQREELALPEEDLPAALNELLESPEIHEACILNTCNRIEFVAATDENCCLPKVVRSFYEKRHGLDIREHADGFYFYENDDVAEHIFRVITSLDSMVIGEVDIIHQMKRMYQIASDAGATGLFLDQTFHQAFKVGKQARTDTDISSGTMSVAMAAAEYIRKEQGSFEGLNATVVGSGKMAVQMARNLKKHGIASLTLANRTVEKIAHQADRLDAAVAHLDYLTESLAEQDLLLASIEYNREHLLTEQQIRQIAEVRGERPLTIVDISVPRVVEHLENPPENISIHDIEDFQPILDENFRRRQEAVAEVERIIERAVRKFSLWRQEAVVLPDVIRLRKKVKSICTEELEKREGRIPVDMLPVMREFANAISERIIQSPIQTLKSNAVQTDAADSLVNFRQLFELEGGAEGGSEEDGARQAHSGSSAAAETDTGNDGSAGTGAGRAGSLYSLYGAAAGHWKQTSAQGGHYCSIYACECSGATEAGSEPES